MEETEIKYDIFSPYNNKDGNCGGVVLILIGVRIVLEHVLA